MTRITWLIFMVLAPVVFAESQMASTNAIDWKGALEGEHRSDAHKQRDAFRHPRETLEFFGLAPGMTVLEVYPGGGWYTEVLAPALADEGTLIAGHGSPNGGAYSRRSLGRYLQKLGENDAVYGGVKVRVLQPSVMPLAVPAASVDMALVFRNVHSWLRAGNAEVSLSDIFRVLAPGATLGVVQHRGVEGISLEQMKRTGYVTEAKVIALAEAAGFVLDAKSEVNANVKDTKDYPRGVWTLPPSFREGDTDRSRYAAIGESDRMTLRFVKPE